MGLKVWTCQVRGAVVVLGGLKAGGRLLACAGHASGEVHVRDLSLGTRGRSRAGSRVQVWIRRCGWTWGMVLLDQNGGMGEELTMVSMTMASMV